MNEAKLAAVKAQMTKTEKVAACCLFGSLAVGVGGALAYETYAIASSRTPTISRIAAGEIAVYPRRAVVVAFVAGGAVTGLIAHFADVIKSWQPD